MRMLTSIKVDVFEEDLCIAFLFLIFFCELTNKNSLIDRAGFITSIKKKIISESYLTSLV